MSATASSADVKIDEPKEPAETFEHFSLSEFHLSSALWAANFFVLWPLGLALTVDVDKSTDPPTYSNLHVREWVFPDGHKETINLDADENTALYQKLLSFAYKRVMAMPPGERRLAITRLAQFEIVTADKLIVAGGK